MRHFDEFFITRTNQLIISKQTADKAKQTADKVKQTADKAKQSAVLISLQLWKLLTFNWSSFHASRYFERL